MAADSYGQKNQPLFSGSGVPQDAADLSLVSSYAARLGNRRVGTKATRQGLSGNDVFEGLDYWETDTELGYRVVNGSWVLWDEWTGWNNLPGLSANYATDDGAAYERVTQSGRRFIVLRGQLTRRTGNMGEADGLFTFASGNRPPYPMAYSQPGVAGVTVRLRITTDGLMQTLGIGGGNTQYVRLDGIQIPLN